MNLNFIYCIDDNFNKQFTVSAFSLLEKVSEKINIHILHQKPETIRNLIDKIENHKMCNEITFYKIETDGISFPNINNKHVSEATYYRLFIEKYVKIDDFVIYLDADTLIINNPIFELRNEIKNLNNKDLYIGACLETDVKKSPDIFKRLELDGEHYFNAGVLILNLEQLRKINFTLESVSLMNKLNTRIIQWDQDVLNKFFDKKYLTISDSLNFKLINDLFEPNKNQFILHYLGSKKPWTFEGLLFNSSLFYQNTYMKLYDTNLYHLTTKWRLNTYIQLFKFIFSKNIFRNKNYLKIIISTLLVKKLKT